MAERGADPSATYRLQLRPGFGFDEAAALADYLAALGVSHVYLSPCLQAAPGSTHGYDVIDHSRVNEELGGEAAHARMCDAFGAAGLGQVLDIVPNHMAVHAGNRWWWDVLENGPASLYASHFDVDWDPPETKLRDTVLLPVLGDHYGRVIRAGDIMVVRTAGTFTVHYHEHRFPVAPRSLGPVLASAAHECRSDDLAFIADAYASLPLPTAVDRESVARRHRDKEVLCRQLSRLCDEDRGVALAVDEAVAALNADPDRLGAFLDAQSYRLAYWRTAERELDYRRFFDITMLAALRVEDEAVFADSHELILGWLATGVLDGVRIDHPDGLRDPERYLLRLSGAAPEAWVVVEKILEPGEHLPASWPVAGTTGYEFLNTVLGLFVDPAGEAPLTELYADLTGATADWEQASYDARHQAMREGLAADINRLTNLLAQICEASPYWRDYTRHELHEALRETAACFPVYRTYLRPGEDARGEDVEHLTRAVTVATERRPDLDAGLFDLLGAILGGRIEGDLETELLLRFQQTTGPVMAKGVEDTAFYRFVRLAALCDVGGNPGRFGVGVEEFHDAMARSQTSWPLTMTTTSTHDTKRSEDVRVRLALLSEIPDRWATTVRRWMAVNSRHRVDDLPDRNAEYLLYQTLVAAWPLEPARAVAYMEKAAREAKSHTSWTAQDPDYESALRGFVEAVLSDETFVADLDAFAAALVEPGRVVSLAQTLLKLTAPGVPDTYQGCELWDLSLVDPDNRRPVDWNLRRRLLSELDGMSPEEAWKRAGDGLPKLLVTREALRLRRRRPEAFGREATYEPVVATGSGADRVVAFTRTDIAVTVVPRLVLGLGGGWGDTSIALPDGHWRNLLTREDRRGGAVAIDELLARLPVALLERMEEGSRS